MAKEQAMKIASAISICASVAGAFLLFPAAAEAGGGGGGHCSGFSTGAELIMRDSCFDGVAHFVSGGTTLVVENRGVLPHSFTAVDGSFDTGILQPGEISEIRLGDDGNVRVLCTLHGTAQGAGMAGVLLVGESQQGAAGNVSPFANLPGNLDAPTQDEPMEQLDSVERIEDTLSDLRISSRNTTVAVVAMGSLLGILMIGVGYRTRRSAAE